ncbi:MAG TPA: hypothetical protein VM487_25550 [Phycisphaerae bacterium]|nr:hypothetical protein [Phycisphaerae bacterium]
MLRMIVWNRLAEAVGIIRLARALGDLLARAMPRQLIGTSLGIGLAIGVTGCRHEPLAQRRLAMRWDNIRTTTERITDREAQSPQRLARAAEFTRDDLRRHAIAFERDLHGVAAYLERDLRRWQESQPTYWRETGRLLRGKPETIERTAIILFL